jgi:protein-S-isoprenylcysteine O-methyltransferase Ste14
LSILTIFIAAVAFLIYRQQKQKNEQQFQENFGTTFQDYVEFVHSINYKFETTIDEINYLIVPK